MQVDRCKACLMPSSAFKQHNENCDYCLNAKFQAEKYYTLDDIKNFAQTSKGKYDCLVPISGGRDSSYVLYYTKEVLGLKPLTVNFNNGFVTPQAILNMRNCVETLGVDFISYSMNNIYFTKLLQKSFSENGEFCTPCNAAKKYISKKVAYQNGINLVIRGISSVLDNNHSDNKYHDIFNNGIDNFKQNAELFSDENEKLFFDDYINMDLWGNDIKFIELPNIIDWNFHEVNKILSEKCGWTIPPDSFYHKDCELLPILYYLQYRKFGYSDQQVYLSNLLKYKIVTKESIIHLLAGNEVTELPENLPDLLNKIGFDIIQFKEIICKHWNISI